MRLCQFDGCQTRLQFKPRDEYSHYACSNGALDYCIAVVIEFVKVKVTVGICEHIVTKIVKIITYNRSCVARLIHIEIVLKACRIGQSGKAGKDFSKTL